MRQATLHRLVVVAERFCAPVSITVNILTGGRWETFCARVCRNVLQGTEPLWLWEGIESGLDRFGLYPDHCLRSVAYRENIACGVKHCDLSDAFKDGNPG